VEADPRTAAFAGGSWRDPDPGEVVCNVCGWVGGRFEGVAHSESATCPSCGSIARDRFLWFCYLARQAYRPGLRVLETSPRLGPAYKAFMASWCHYYSADFMQSAHAGALCLDLQRLGLRDRCLDVVLTPHVLEHVPDTDAALTELHRVLAPAGAVYLQVPLLEGRTREPPEPEYHGDDTKVFWRFGFDLTARLREHGFDASLLVTADFRRRVASGDLDWPDQHFDVAAMARHAVLDDLVVVCDDRTARRHGFEPSYWFATWEMVRR
jgi:SAM-dependent methyltransferase